MAPDLSPARFAIAIQGSTIGVGRRLIVSLLEKDFRNAILSQRAVLVQIEGLVEFGKSAGKVSLLLQGLSAQNGSAQLYVRRIGEHVVVGIDRDPARATKSFHGERRTG